MIYTVDRIYWALKNMPLDAKVWKKHGLERIYITGGYIELDSLGNPVYRHISEKRCPLTIDEIKTAIETANYAEFELSQSSVETNRSSGEWCFGAADEESF